MYMRLVQARYKPDSLSKIRQIFDEKIIPQLQKTPGCFYICLMKSEFHQDEAISMSLWDTKTHVEEYQKSGLYNEFLEEIKPHLSESSEWKIQLSKDLTLEYQPVPEEPVIKSYTTIAQLDTKIPAQEKTPVLYLRLLSVRIQSGKMDEFKKIYKNDIIPTLQTIKGCLYAYLTENIENKNEVISLTIWDNKQNADDYERSGLFDKLNEKVKHTFAELYQWKMSLEKEYSGKIVTSEDPNIKYYSMVTGKSFQ